VQESDYDLGVHRATRQFNTGRVARNRNFRRWTIRGNRDSPRRDVELTKLRHETGDYHDAASYVNQDGKEYLVGCDVGHRREQVYERDRHHCVKCGRYVTWEQMEMHHRAKNYGGRRWDNLDNLEVRCHDCHTGVNGVHA
jgi:hypothetical protein